MQSAVQTLQSTDYKFYWSTLTVEKDLAYKLGLKLSAKNDRQVVKYIQHNIL